MKKNIYNPLSFCCENFSLDTILIKMEEKLEEGEKQVVNLIYSFIIHGRSFLSV